MLRLRVITALILAPLIIWSVLALSHRALAIEFGLVLALAAWEWARLSGLQHQIARVVFAIFMILVMILLTALMHESVLWLPYLLYANLVWWGLAFILVLRYRGPASQPSEKLDSLEIAVNLLAGVVIIGGAFVAMIGLHDLPGKGVEYFLALLLLIWIADIGAYFAGKKFGKHKLSPHVSPGKTWEGVFGATFAVVIAALLIGQWFGFSIISLAWFTGLALLTMAFSILGDLTESLFKRRVGVKDSSNLIPGHGGILDRIDSLMAAAPVFLLGLLQAGFK